MRPAASSDRGHWRDGGLLAGGDARRAKLNRPTSRHAILTTAELISALQAGPTAADSYSTLEGDVMSNVWYARPVLFVADIDRSVEFYVKQLGFSNPWRYEEEGKTWVAQVERRGCELILSSQWPEKVGNGLLFISLDVEVLDALRAELEGRGVDVKDGRWGYRLMVVVDPDRNELYFPYPADDKKT
jgi:catechol 2,3-dioxygenase-like lactoylglutathione lyase family enzyme